jgi:hypothetical protein
LAGHDGNRDRYGPVLRARTTGQLCLMPGVKSTILAMIFRRISGPADTQGHASLIFTFIALN